jgi:hypothetical protein
MYLEVRETVDTMKFILVLLGIAVLAVVVLVATRVPTSSAPGLAPSPTQSSKTLFFDDFENGPDAGWSFPTGNWETRNGWLQLAGWYNSGTFYGYVRNGAQWTDYVVEADLHFTGYEQGLVLRARDDLNKVVLWGGYAGLWFSVWRDGRQVVERAAEVENGWPLDCHVAVEVKGTTYNVYVNGTLRVIYRDSTFLSGTVGVVLSGASGGTALDPSRFDNLRVRTLQ